MIFHKLFFDTFKNKNDVTVKNPWKWFKISSKLNLGLIQIRFFSFVTKI